MPKTITEIRSLARSHTRTALNVLVGVMRNTKATAPARIAAANAILDRGWGKATQAIENGAVHEEGDFTLAVGDGLLLLASWLWRWRRPA